MAPIELISLCFTIVFKSFYSLARYGLLSSLIDIKINETKSSGNASRVAYLRLVIRQQESRSDTATGYKRKTYTTGNISVRKRSSVQKRPQTHKEDKIDCRIHGENKQTLEDRRSCCACYRDSTRSSD